MDAEKLEHLTGAAMVKLQGQLECLLESRNKLERIREAISKGVELEIVDSLLTQVIDNIETAIAYYA